MCVNRESVYVIWPFISDGHFHSLSGLKHWIKSKVVNLISDPNLFKCIMDPEVMSMLNPTKEGLGAAQYAKYSVFNFLKHPDLDSFKRTGKVSFVQCKKWLIFHEPLVPWSRSVVDINKWSDGFLWLPLNAYAITKIDYKMTINLLSFHISRCAIFRWIRNWSQNLDSS